MLVESRMRGDVHVRFGGRSRGNGAGVIRSPRPLPTRHVPLSPTGAELLFEVFSQRYERGSIIVTSNLPFDEWTSVFASERLTGARLDRLTHHVHILEMNGDSYRLKQSKRRPRADLTPPITPISD
jgi:hypothetical protein